MYSRSCPSVVFNFFSCKWYKPASGLGLCASYVYKPQCRSWKKVERICIAAFSSCYRASAAAPIHTRRNFKVPGLFTPGARNQSGAIQCRRTRTETHSLIQVRVETGRAKKSCLRKKIPGDAEGKNYSGELWQGRGWNEDFCAAPVRTTPFSIYSNCFIRAVDTKKKERRWHDWNDWLTEWISLRLFGFCLAHKFWWKPRGNTLSESGGWVGARTLKCDVGMGILEHLTQICEIVVKKCRLWHLKLSSLDIGVFLKGFLESEILNLRVHECGTKGKILKLCLWSLYFYNNK